MADVWRREIEGGATTRNEVHSPAGDSIGTCASCWRPSASSMRASRVAAWVSIAGLASYSGFMRGCRSFPSLSSMRLGTIASSLGSTADRDLCLSACTVTIG